MTEPLDGTPRFRTLDDIAEHIGLTISLEFPAGPTMLVVDESDHKGSRQFWRFTTRKRRRTYTLDWAPGEMTQHVEPDAVFELLASRAANAEPDLATLEQYSEWIRTGQMGEAYRHHHDVYAYEFLEALLKGWDVTVDDVVATWLAQFGEARP